MLKALIAEAVGVFALCFVGGGAILTNAYLGENGPGLLGIALAHGLILALVVTATMNVSGGHINPAVTFGLLVTGRIGMVRAVGYMIAQVVGGSIAGIVLSTVVFVGLETPNRESVVQKVQNGTPHYDVYVLGATKDDPMSSLKPADRQQIERRAAIRAALIEAILTFFLVFMVYGTAVDPRHPNVGGFAIGLTVAVDILAGGPLTGAGMNPARVFGTGFLGAAPEFWGQQWVYWVGPLVGGAVAGLLYHHVIMEKPAAPKPSAS